MRDIYEKFNLNREKVTFLLTLLIVGVYAGGKIMSSSGGLTSFQQGLLKEIPVKPLKKGLGEKAGLVTEPEFVDYWDPDRSGPFFVVSDWKKLPPAKLEYPALPALRRVMLPPIPGPAAARLYQLAREFPEHKVEIVDEGTGEAGGGEEEAGGGEEDGGNGDGAGKDAIDEEQKKSRFYGEVRKLDQVDMKDGTIHFGRIIDEDGGQLTVELKGKKGMRVALLKTKIGKVISRISLSEVYDKKLTGLGGKDVLNGLAWIEDCIAFGFREVAVKHLALLIEVNPTDRRPYLVAGRYFGDVFAYDQLASLFMLAAANGVKSPALRWREAKFLARPFSRYFERAISLYGQAIPDLGSTEKDPARYELAGILIDQGELEKAKSLCRELMRGETYKAKGRIRLCRVLIAQGQLQSAMQILGGEEVTDAGSVGLRGVVRLLEGKMAEAIADLTSARTADPTSFAAAYNLGLAYLYAGNPDPARKEFDAARQIGLDDPSMAYLGLGLCDHRSGKPDVAVAGGYAAALKANANTNAMAHYLTGLAILDSRGDREQAKQSFANAVRIDFEFVEAHIRLGAMAIEDGDQITAQMHLEQAALLHQDALVYAYLGRAFLVTGNLERAERAYQWGLSRDPSSVFCKEGQGYVLNAKGEQKLSEQAFRVIKTPYAQAAKDLIKENQDRRAWTDQFTRKDKEGKILRKWVESEGAGVTIRLDNSGVLFEGRQSRVDRLTELSRELKGRTFVSMAVDVLAADQNKAHVGIHLARPGPKGRSMGGVCFGITLGGQLFYGLYNREKPTQMNEEEFQAGTYKLLGAVKDHMDQSGVVRLECALVDARGRFMFRAGGKDLLEKPVTLSTLRGRTLQLGIFGAAPLETAWKLRVDNVQATSTSTGRRK